MKKLLNNFASVRVRVAALLAILAIMAVVAGAQSQAGKQFQAEFFTLKKLSTAPPKAFIKSTELGLYLDSSGVPSLESSTGTVTKFVTGGSAALSANRFVYAGTGGAITAASAATNGQLLIGSTGVAPALAALTAGTGMTVTNGAGSITLTPNFASPPAIGSGTPALITGTTITANSSLVVNGGTPVTKILSASGTLDFASTNAQTSSELTITVTGAAVGDPVFIGLPAAPNANASFTAYVSAADTVTVRFNNYSSGAIDPASASYRVTVFHF